ncbi:MAG: hypothetical protein ABIQ88_16670 [Chitinophagaceae bacterium]
MNEPLHTKKILLVQLFSNGDCLYATTIARQIKTDYPHCHLTWAIAAFCKNIIDENPYVDAVMVVNDVPKNDLAAFRKLKRKFHAEKEAGKWDEVFVTQNMDGNLAYYDGCIRTGVYRAYPHPVTVSTTPVLRLTEAEKNNAAAFAANNKLEDYRVRLLFEFAPLSGQVPMTRDIAISIAEKVVKDPEVVVILSSALKIDHPNSQIIDGSVLTLRETAGLSFFCTHLLGCSSGISWATTSDGAKLLPMVQLINPGTIWLNAVSRDFKRFNKSTDNIIDLIGLDEEKIEACLQLCFRDFAAARKKYNQEIPLKFTSSRNIVYNLLTQLQFKYIARHIAANREVYGNNWLFYRTVFATVLFSPFTFIRNYYKKRILHKK